MSTTLVTEPGLAAFYLPIWLGHEPSPPKTIGRDELDLAMQEVVGARLDAGAMLRVSREGYFLFDFSEHPTAGPVQNHNYRSVLAARARLMNLFLACLLNELRHEKKHVEHLLIDETTIMGPRDAVLDPMRAATEYSNHYRVVGERQRLFLRQTFSRDRIEAAIDATNTATRSAGGRDLLAEMILQAHSQFLLGQMEASLVTSWTVVEHCLNELWEQYIKRQGELGVAKIVKGRRERLRGASFTASVIAEILSLAGELSPNDYDSLSAVRRKRNDWVHSLAAIGPRDAGDAIVLAQAMLRAAKLLNLEISFLTIKTYPLSFVSPKDPTGPAGPPRS